MGKTSKWYEVTYQDKVTGKYISMLSHGKKEAREYQKQHPGSVLKVLIFK